jgi:hypothetical protein
MRRMVLAVIVALLLAGGGWVAGQTAQVQPYRAPAHPGILTGADIGFRVEGKTREGAVIGRLMVRLPNGQWVEAHGSPTNGRVVPLEVK